MTSEDWKHYPQTWYAVALDKHLKIGEIVSGQLGGLAYVVYRDHTGSLHAMDAFCPHMGAHLQSGKVSGCGIVCGLHGYTVEPDHALSSSAHTPCSLKNRAWFCVARFGLIWLYPPVADGVMPPLPFASLSEHDLIWTHATRRIHADWRAMICNGFDIAHMKTVHQREVIGEPQFTLLPENALRMDYQTRVLPKGGWSSRVMQKLSGGRIVLSHTCCGSAILVNSQVGAFKTMGIFALLPQNSPDTPPEWRQTQAFATIAVPKTAKWAKLQLWLARCLYLAFLRKDFDVVEKMRMRLDGVDDVGVRAVAAFQATLPEIDGGTST